MNATRRTDAPRITSPLRPAAFLGFKRGSSFGVAVQDAATQKVQSVSGGVLSQAFEGGAIEAENLQSSLSTGGRLGIAPPVMAETPAVQLMGLTTAVNSFQGAVAFDLAKQRFKVAYAAGDTLGMIESAIDMLRGIAQSLFGTAFLGYRITQACVLAEGASASATTVKAAALLSAIAVPLMIAFFAAVGLWGVVKLYKDVKFYVQLSLARSQGDVALFQFLSKRVSLDSKRELFKLRGVKSFNEVKAYRELIRAEGLELLTDLKMVSDPQADRMHVREETSAFFQQDLKSTSAYRECLKVLGIENTDIGALDFSLLELVGFCVQETRRDARKVAKWDRLTETGCTAAVRKAVERGLGERLTSSDALTQGAAQKELHALAGRAKGANTKQMLIHSACIAIGMLGVASLVVVGWHMVIITAVVTGVMLLLDAYLAHEALNSKGPVGHFSKQYALFIGILAVASFVASGLLTGWVVIPLIVSGIIMLTGVLLSAYAYYKLVVKEKQWEADHPTLQGFSDLLKQNPTPEAIETTFKHLSREERARIKAAYKAELRSHPEQSRKLTEITDKQQRAVLFAKAAKKSWKHFALATPSTEAATVARRALDAVVQSIDLDTKEAHAVLHDALEAVTHNRIVNEHLAEDISLIMARRCNDALFQRAVQTVSKRLSAI
jgi:hypothetical protein